MTPRRPTTPAFSLRTPPGAFSPHFRFASPHFRFHHWPPSSFLGAHSELIWLAVLLHYPHTIFSVPKGGATDQDVSGPAPMTSGRQREDRLRGGIARTRNAGESTSEGHPGIAKPGRLGAWGSERASRAARTTACIVCTTRGFPRRRGTGLPPRVIGGIARPRQAQCGT